MPILSDAHLKAGNRPALSGGVVKEMCECCKRGRVWTFEEVVGMFRKEYTKFEGRRVILRCPVCDGRILKKVRPETTKTVKAR